MNNELQKKFYSKERNNKKTIMVCIDEPKIGMIFTKLLSPVAEVIVVNNNEFIWEYEEKTIFCKEPVDVVFLGVLMDGMDGFLIMKDILNFNEKQIVCSISKKEENELFKIMFQNTSHIKLPIDFNNFFEVCLKLDI